jgi:hypothetical protein
MSFTSHELAATSPTGVYNGEYGFSVTWRLFASSGDDGPDAALDYVSLNIAQWEDPYYLGSQTYSSSSSPSSGADSNNRALLSEVKVSRVQSSADPWVWLAVLTYSEPQGAGDGEQPDGSTSGDPTDFAAEVEIQTVQYSKPCDKAIYISGYNSVAATVVNDGAARPIVNSALCVFDPPPEVDTHKFVIRIVKNLASLDCDTIKTNVVNTYPVTVNYRGLTKTIAAYCGKTRDISAVPIKHPVIGWYVKVQLYIDVDDNGWRLQILDRGFSARMLEGDPDGKGGTITGSGTRALADGSVPQRRLVDQTTGAPISEPAMLDGNGQPLHESADNDAPKTPVYGVWKYYQEVDFNTWPILWDVISTDSSSA